MCAHPKRRKRRPLQASFFLSAIFQTIVTVKPSTLPLSQPEQLRRITHHFLPTSPKPIYQSLSLTQQISRPLIVSSRDNETPHPQLFDLRPQSLQTRTGGFPSTPPRRGVGTRGDGIEPGVSGQCSASSRVEGRQESGR